MLFVSLCHYFTMYGCLSILCYILAWFTLCFTIDSESNSLSPLLMAIAALSHHSVSSLSTVKHTAIMTPVPEKPETSVRFFPVTALLCDVLLHCFVRKCTILDSAFVFHQTGKIIRKPQSAPFSLCLGLQGHVTLALCICTVFHCSSHVLFIFYLSLSNRVIYLVYCFHVAPRSALQNSVSPLTAKVSPLLMSFAIASVCHHEYASTHAPTLCAEVPYLCFLCCSFTYTRLSQGEVVRGCIWSAAADGMEWRGGGGLGMLSITPQCFHVSCYFTVDNETL